MQGKVTGVLAIYNKRFPGGREVGWVGGYHKERFSGTYEDKVLN